MKEKMSRKTASIITATGIGILLAAVLLVSSITVIPTGYTGVRSTFGQISEKPVSSGLKLKVPLIQSIEKVNNKQQDIVFNSQIWSETKERTAIYYADVTVTYQISPEKSTWIYANVTNYRDNLVSQSLVASAIKASSKELSDTDATNRSIIEPQAMENIQKALDEKYGENVVVVNKVVIGNADFDDSYNEAIAAKQKATLEAQQQAIENQKAIDKAKADASVIKTTAEAEAEAKVIAAQAEADANKLLEESLSDSVLKDKYLEKWDGSLPKYVGGDGSNILIGMDE
jgi:regulator of protease activity HflC (stomatin/prohibitin superfamily)